MKTIIISKSDGFIPKTMLSEKIMVTSGIEKHFGPLNEPCGPVKQNLFALKKCLPGMTDKEAVEKTKQMERDEVLHTYFWLVRNWAECELPTDDTQIIIGHCGRLPIFAYCANNTFMLNNNPGGFINKTTLLHSQG